MTMLNIALEGLDMNSAMLSKVTLKFNNFLSTGEEGHLHILIEQNLRATN